jgi:diamine N-acetyltransferase
MQATIECARAQEEIHVDKNVVLKGDRIVLRPLEWEDVLQIQQWWMDPGLRKLIGEIEPMSDGACRELFRKAREDESRLWFVIELLETGRVIGEAGLLRIFPAWRTTDLTMILGEPDARGQGYGTEAIHLLLRHAFDVLRLHRVAVGVVGFNDTALAFYEKAGFKREGLQRDGYFCDNRFSDFVMMSVLSDEYSALHGPAVAAPGGRG